VGAASLGGNAFYFNGVEKDQFTLERGRVYKFIQSSGTNVSHPIAFSTTNDGTHGGGAVYNTGVTSSGTVGNNGAYTQIIVSQNLTSLYYYCVNHSGMGSNFVITNPSNSIAASTIATYTGTYLIGQGAANTGKVINSVTVVGSSPGNNGDVSDVSDDGDDGDGNTTNDPTEIITSTDFSIAVTKSASVNDNNSNGKVDAGDRIDYTITVSNTGNANLTGLKIQDILTDGNGVALTLSTSPTFTSASAGSTSSTIDADFVTAIEKSVDVIISVGSFVVLPSPSSPSSDTSDTSPLFPGEEPTTVTEFITFPVLAAPCPIKYVPVYVAIVLAAILFEGLVITKLDPIPE
jgi:uncharacterized repeat protein (TIGR01451 family)